MCKSFPSTIDNLPQRFRDAGFRNYYPRDEFEEKIKQNLIRFSTNKDEKRSLFFTGSYGTGKTHLAVAVLKNLWGILKDVQISNTSGTKKTEIKPFPQRTLFLVMDELFQELNDCAVKKISKLNHIYRILREYDMILLDDLRLDHFTDAKKENLYLLINRAHLDKKRFIITSNITMEQLEITEPRIASRISDMCCIIKFQGKDYRKETAAIRDPESRVQT